MVAGGAEAAVCPIRHRGFYRLPRLVDQLQRSRRRAPRGPTTRTATALSWARAPAWWCSRNYEHAKARGADLCRAGRLWPAGDAYHITAPADDGDGGYRAMRRLSATPESRRPTSTTSTPTAPRRRWATRSRLGASSGCWARRPASLRMSSTKSSIGHLLGRAGAVEAAFTVLATARPDRAPDASTSTIPRWRPPSIWCPSGKAMKIDIALSNCFGFGGTNASLVFRRLMD